VFVDIHSQPGEMPNIETTHQ